MVCYCCRWSSECREHAVTKFQRDSCLYKCKVVWVKYWNTAVTQQLLLRSKSVLYKIKQKECRIIIERKWSQIDTGSCNSLKITSNCQNFATPLITHIGYTLRNNENCHTYTVMCCGTARHGRMTESTNQSHWEVRSWRRTNSGETIQLPTDDQMNSRHDNNAFTKRPLHGTDSSLQYGHQT